MRIKWLEFKRRTPGWPRWMTLNWTVASLIILWLLRIFYRLRRRNMDAVPERGACIFVSNHQSHFDPIAVGVFVRDRPFSALARDTLFDNKLLGLMMTSVGVIPLKRGAGDKGAIKAATNELNAGRTVFLFPEGTRTRDGALGDFKMGVMLLVRRTGAPVLPIGIDGAYDIWPYGTSKPKWTGRMVVRAGEVIPAEELLKDGPDAGLARLKREIDALRLECRAELRHRTNGRYPASGPGDEAASDTLNA